MLRLCDISLRDPFILPEAGVYYLYGSRTVNVWEGKCTGLDVYRSADLTHWEGPFLAFEPGPGFWADRNFWSPEVHRYRGKFYMIASFRFETRARGVQFLVADSPMGPFVPLTDEPVTPPDWSCLDGALFVEADGTPDGTPYLVFCHEWSQIVNGEICAMPLTDDLKRPAGPIRTLLDARSAPWGIVSTPIPPYGYVTDGPFFYRTSNGTLLMLWSSFSKNGYTVASARSDNGALTGSWTHDPELIADCDGGPGMLFRAFDGRLWFAMHCPNTDGQERPVLLRAVDTGDNVRLQVQDCPF